MGITEERTFSIRKMISILFDNDVPESVQMRYVAAHAEKMESSCIKYSERVPVSRDRAEVNLLDRHLHVTNSALPFRNCFQRARSW